MISTPFVVFAFGRLSGVGVDGRLTGFFFFFSLRAGLDLVVRKRCCSTS